MLAKRIISQNKQLVRGECKSSRSQQPCGSLQESLQSTHVGSVHASDICGPSQARNCEINDVEFVSCMDFKGDERSDSPTVTQHKERMLTLLLKLS